MALIKCPDCGREVSSRAVSCPNCGCPISEIVASEGTAPVSTAAPTAPTVDSGKERQLIIAHLKDLCTLELIKWKYEKPIAKAAADFGITNYNNAFDFVSRILEKVSKGITSASSNIYQMTPLQFSNALREEAGPITLISVKVDGKKVSLPRYIYDADGYPDWGPVFDAVSDKYSALYNEHSDEKRKVTAALKTAYDANIIPAPFRNLHGVYYLHDYLSTSQESLSDALLHLDLDIIKSKLDTVIKQQGEILLQTYITNLQLASVQQKFDQLLDAVQSISQDTAAIAKYSAISATHLETIKILQFIK